VPRTFVWLPGIISDISGPLTYVVTLEDGRVIRRHVDHLLRREKTNSSPPTEDDVVVLNDRSDVADSRDAEDAAIPTPRNTTERC